MRDPNIEKIIEANKEELKLGDIKKTVLQVRDYLTSVVKDEKKRNEELKQEIEFLTKEYQDETIN
jgi:chemotaxis regulatin CheY-phosphate phosphatase CheZ